MEILKTELLLLLNNIWDLVGKTGLSNSSCGAGWIAKYISTWEVVLA